MHWESGDANVMNRFHQQTHEAMCLQASGTGHIRLLARQMGFSFLGHYRQAPSLLSLFNYRASLPVQKA